MKKGAAVWIKAGDRVRYAGWEYMVEQVYADPLRFDLEPAEGDAGKRVPQRGVAFQHIDAKISTKLPADLLARGSDDYADYAPPAVEARAKLDDVNADLAAAEQRINDGLVALGEATDRNRRLQDALDAARKVAANAQAEAAEARALYKGVQAGYEKANAERVEALNKLDWAQGELSKIWKALG